MDKRFKKDKFDKVVNLRLTEKQYDRLCEYAIANNKSLTASARDIVSYEVEKYLAQ